MGCFKKFNSFALQKEWRLAVRFPDKSDKDVYIGSLHDIAFPPISEEDFYKIKIQVKV